MNPSSFQVFLIAGGVYLFGIIFFALFASGEAQPWAKGYVEAKRPGTIQ